MNDNITTELSTEAANPRFCKGAVSGSDTIKSCQNCKFYTPEKNRCNHEYWSWCVKRDDDGYVKSYAYHHFR